jgi:hypothetical protein
MYARKRTVRACTKTPRTSTQKEGRTGSGIYNIIWLHPLPPHPPPQKKILWFFTMLRKETYHAYNNFSFLRNLEKKITKKS